MNNTHQILIALCETYTVNVAAMTAVLSASRSLCNARPLEQFYLRKNTDITIRDKQTLYNTNLSKVVGSSDNSSSMRPTQACAQT